MKNGFSNMSQLIESIVSKENIRVATNFMRLKHPLHRDRNWLGTDIDEKLTGIAYSLAPGTFQPEKVDYFYSISEKRLLCAQFDFRSLIAIEAMSNPLRRVLNKKSIITCAFEPTQIEYLIQHGRKWKNESKWLAIVDIQRFFNSIEHQILLNELAQQISCKTTLKLLKNLLNSFDSASAEFSKIETQHIHIPGMGLPVGVELVYLLTNAFLKKIDQNLAKSARRKITRYIDDYLIFGESEQEMVDIINILAANLGKIGLTLNPAKTQIQPCSKPVSYLRQKL